MYSPNKGVDCFFTLHASGNYYTTLCKGIKTENKTKATAASLKT